MGKYRELFERLADEQDPHTLVITCSDSRINPHLVTGAEPGDIFILRRRPAYCASRWLRSDPCRGRDHRVRRGSPQRA